MHTSTYQTKSMCPSIHPLTAKKTRAMTTCTATLTTKKLRARRASVESSSGGRFHWYKRLYLSCVWGVRVFCGSVGECCGWACKGNKPCVFFAAGGWIHRDVVGAWGAGIVPVYAQPSRPILLLLP